MKRSVLFFLLTPFWLLAQSDAKTCEILSNINTLLQQEHIQPKPIDDSLSVFVFDHFIDELDPSRKILLKTEFDALSKKYRFTIDDAIKTGNCAFYSDILKVYKKALERSKTVYKKIASVKIDFDRVDTIRYYKKAYPFYLVENLLETAYRKKIKFEILDDITSRSNNLDSIKDHFKAMIKVSQKTVIDNELCKINMELQNSSHYDAKLYSLFCNYFDPHSDYFNMDSRSSFVASLSKEHLSLGFNLKLNERNEIIIGEIDPNGPAFRSGKIKKGDQIIAISNTKQQLQVSCATMESISNMILSENNKTITLTLRRNSGKNFEVAIEKQLLNDAENSVYSFIIEQNNKKYGYVKIPSFYSDFEGNKGKGCAEDVAVEVLKLQKENIEGLVLDIMDNGGGSIEEAIKLSGMFIDNGPISIVTNNKQNQTVIYDPYDGMLITKPIVVLMNGNSASASEFFASALRDYNRAILIGSTTIGKATMQTIQPLEENDEVNFIKITINKFYNISGTSHQGIGVQPDITLPELYETLWGKENESKNSFQNDTLAGSITFKPNLNNNWIKKIIPNSQERIASDTYFTEIKQLNKKIEQLVGYEKSATALTIDAIYKDHQEISHLLEDINHIEELKTNLVISNSYLNDFHFKINPIEKVYNDYQMELSKTNHYLKEAVNILEEVTTLK